MDVVSLIALTLGAGWASGINLYAAVLTLGLAGFTGSMQLPPGLEILANPLVIAAAGLRYSVNFFTDKIPFIDSLSDVVHSFIKIPAAALSAAGAAGDMDPTIMLVVGLLGGTLAAGSHLTKAGTRALINTSPEPFSNIAASIGEDIAVFGGLWIALNHPWLFLGLLLALVALTIWLLPKLLRLIARGFRRVRDWMRGTPTAPPAATPPNGTPAAPSPG